MSHENIANNQENFEVVNISSSTAFQQIPGYATYGATKNAIGYWSEVINSEPNNIRTMTVYPGGMSTQLKQIKKNRIRTALLPPNKVGRIIFEKLQTGSTGRLVIGSRAKIFLVLEHLLPRGFQRKLWGLLENRI